MALIAIIIFLSSLVIGRILIYYQQNKKFGFENDSIFNPLSLIVLLLIICGFSGMLYTAILEFNDKFNSQFNIWSFSIITGWMIFFIGLILSAISQHQMGKSWRMAGTNSNNTDLITSGLFRYSRNPIYLGILISFIGLVILIPNIIAAVCYTVFYIAFYLLVRFVEEPHLKIVHKLKYQNYCNKVNRFFPQLF